MDNVVSWLGLNLYSLGVGILFTLIPYIIAGSVYGLLMICWRDMTVLFIMFTVWNIVFVITIIYVLLLHGIVPAIFTTVLGWFSYIWLLKWDKNRN